MRRILMMVVRLFLKSPYYIIKIWVMSKSKKVSIEQSFAFIKKVTKAANRAGKVNIEVYGIENIPKEDGFIFYPNHQGMYDVLVFLDSCPKVFSFVAKKEARNLFLIKQVGDCLGALAIDREDIRQSMKVILKMSEEVSKGKNFLIFAEGTRNRNGNIPGEFKGGSFKAAYKAKCPIVPCALIDSFKPFDEKSIQPVTVKVIYLSPINYEEYCNMKTVEIAEVVKKRIEKAISEHMD